MLSYLIIDKLTLFIKVSDADTIMGLAHAENISVQAEAYDVALDVSFPKGKLLVIQCC